MERTEVGTKVSDEHTMTTFEVDFADTIIPESTKASSITQQSRATEQTFGGRPLLAQALSVKHSDLRRKTQNQSSEARKQRRQKRKLHNVRWWLF